MLYPDKLTASDITYSVHGRFTIEMQEYIRSITRYERIDADGDLAAFTLNGIPGYMMRTQRDFISMLIENGTAHFRSSSEFWSRLATDKDLIGSSEATPLLCLNMFKERLSTTSLTPAKDNPAYSALCHKKAIQALDDQIKKCSRNGYPRLA
ncbi:hypothetical protein RND59_15100 [Vibrio ruber]|uniref:hypothetical protein n=1 Tax=Vibrio ruber TaxID=184755 RepID=UPI0028934284|nr:hypothetical protein [Vibrio ruber]WNJ95430.1 hypothetical protein RND59_15100 [Vibrio ruber]